MTPTVARERPLAEITLRRYEKPFRLQGRDLAKKLCLSVGLLQPGDSRDVIVDIVSIMFAAKEPLSSESIKAAVEAQRVQHGLPSSGAAHSNIRRQLRRLRDLLLIERHGNSYRLAEGTHLGEVFAERLEKVYLRQIVDRVREYFDAMGGRHSEVKQ